MAVGLLIIQSLGREETSASQILVAKLQHSNAGSGELGSSSFLVTWMLGVSGDRVRAGSGGLFTGFGVCRRRACSNRVCRVRAHIPLFEGWDYE